MTPSEFRYYAFISYSHRDKHWGDWLHKSLETYRVPARLVGQPSRDGTVPARISPIFRDREELPTASDLSNAINDALEQSRYLIVVCSPRSAQSRWVNEEIVTWKRMGKGNRILCLIIDGEPNASDSDDPAQRERECFPPAVRFEVDANGELTDQRGEPIAADARDVGDNKRDAKLKLIAGLLGVGFDALKQREMQRRNRRLAAIAIAATVLLAITSALAVLAVIARGQAETAQQMAEQSERVSRRMLVNTATRSGWREYDGGDALTALLWQTHALQQAEQSPSPLAEDHQAIRHARIRLHHAFRHMPLPRVAVFHDKGVLHAKWSRDGTRFVTGSEDTIVQVWNAQTGETVGKPVQHSSEVEFIEISPDGKWLATGADGDDVRISFVETGEPHIKTMEGELVIPYHASFSPDSKRIAIGDNDKAIVFDVQTGKPVLPPLQHKGGVGAAVFSPDGKWIVSGAADKIAQCWNAQTGEAVGAAMLHGNSVDEVIWTSDSRMIVTVTFDRRVRVWNPLAGQPISETLSPERVNGVAVSPDDSRLALITSGGELTVYDLAKPESVNKPIHTLKVGIGGNTVDYLPDNHRLLVGYGLRADVIDPSMRHVDGTAAHGLPSRAAVIHAAKVSPDGRHMLVADSQGAVRISRIDGRGYSPTVLPVPQEHREETPSFRPSQLRYVNAIYGHSDNDIFAGRSQGMLVHWHREPQGQWASRVLVDPVDSYDPRFFRNPVGPVLHPDGKRVAIAYGKTLWLIDPQTGQQQKLDEPTNREIYNFAISPDGNWLLMDGQSRSFWNLQQNKVIARDLFGKGPIKFAFTRDSSKLIVNETIYGDTDETVLQVWSINALEKPLVEVKAKGAFGQPVVSVDGKTFAISEGESGLVSIRDVNTAEPVGDPLVHRIAVNETGFVPESNWLMTSDGQGLVRLWDLSTRETIAQPVALPGNLYRQNFTPAGRLIGGVGFGLYDVQAGHRVWPLTWRFRLYSRAQFNRTGDEMLLVHKEVHILPVKAVEQPVDELMLWAQWHAQQRIDATGAAAALRPDEIRKLWKTLRDRWPDHP